LLSINLILSVSHLYNYYYLYNKKFFIIIFLVVVALSIFYLTLNINYLNPGEAFFLMADGGESSGRV